MAGDLDQIVRFCLYCGVPLASEERFGQLRPVCPSCGWIWFPDPKVAVALLVESDGKVLLVQRANEPFRGMWSLPAGFMDANEDPKEAAQRECLEETGLTVQVQELIDVIAGRDHPRGAHLVIVYRAVPVRGELIAGDDASAAGFFCRDQLPPLAFTATRKVLLKDRPD